MRKISAVLRLILDEFGESLAEKMHQIESTDSEIWDIALKKQNSAPSETNK